MMQGVGYDSGGKWIKTINRKSTPEYSFWMGMISRCYSKKIHAKQPGYADCSVNSVFHDFQKFCDWAEQQHGYGEPLWQLDKDLVSKGNKEYSPACCIFLPREINNFVIGCNSVRGVWPKGVCVHHNGFRAQCQMGNGRKFTGPKVATVEEAFAAYKTCKEAYAKTLAEKWKHLIDPRSYDALMSYEVLITD